MYKYIKKNSYLNFYNFHFCLNDKVSNYTIKMIMIENHGKIGSVHKA